MDDFNGWMHSLVWSCSQWNLSVEVMGNGAVPRTIIFWGLKWNLKDSHSYGYVFFLVTKHVPCDVEPLAYPITGIGATYSGWNTKRHGGNLQLGKRAESMWVIPWVFLGVDFAEFMQCRYVIQIDTVYLFYFITIFAHIWHNLYHYIYYNVYIYTCLYVVHIHFKDRIIYAFQVLVHSHAFVNTEVHNMYLLIIIYVHSKGILSSQNRHWCRSGYPQLTSSSNPPCCTASTLSCSMRDTLLRWIFIMPGQCKL